MHFCVIMVDELGPTKICHCCNLNICPAGKKSTRRYRCTNCRHGAECCHGHCEMLTWWCLPSSQFAASLWIHLCQSVSRRLQCPGDVLIGPVTATVTLQIQIRGLVLIKFRLGNATHRVVLSIPDPASSLELLCDIICGRLSLPFSAATTLSFYVVDVATPGGLRRVARQETCKSLGLEHGNVLVVRTPELEADAQKELGRLVVTSSATDKTTSVAAATVPHSYTHHDNIDYGEPELARPLAVEELQLRGTHSEVSHARGRH